MMMFDTRTRISAEADILVLVSNIIIIQTRGDMGVRLGT